MAEGGTETIVRYGVCLAVAGVLLAVGTASSALGRDPVDAEAVVGRPFGVATIRLPLMNAVQQMHTRVEYVQFKGGEGVSYLAQYAQGPVPVNNGELFYTFQGLTDDGEFYVSAILPERPVQ